jgi:hypothetical protein
LKTLSTGYGFVSLPVDAPCWIVEFRAYNDEVINRSMVDVFPVTGSILVIF